jgi:hypothetical protein
MTEEQRRRTRRSATRGTGQPRLTGGAYAITPEDEANRRRLWKEGHTAAEIGAAVGRTTDVIREWMNRRGLKPNGTPHTRTPLRVHQLRTDLYESGCTDTEMADVTKSTVAAIKAWRRKQGLTANPGRSHNHRQKVTA